MTFDNYVLSLRRRLQDLRKPNGEIITSALQDGLRWTSNELIDKCNEALQESARLIAIYSNSPIAKQLAEENLIGHNTFSLNTGEYFYDFTTIDVLGVFDVIDAGGKEYDYAPAARFYAYKTTLNETVSVSHFFTMTRDVTTLAKKILIHPAATADSTIYNYAYIIKPTAFTNSAEDLAKELYFQGMDDFLKDVAEKSCRLEEHNLERTKILLDSIKLKLGIESK